MPIGKYISLDLLFEKIKLKERARGFKTSAQNFVRSISDEIREYVDHLENAPVPEENEYFNDEFGYFCNPSKEQVRFGRKLLAKGIRFLPYGVAATGLVIVIYYIYTRPNYLKDLRVGKTPPITIVAQETLKNPNLSRKEFLVKTLQVVSVVVVIGGVVFLVHKLLKETDPEGVKRDFPLVPPIFDASGVKETLGKIKEDLQNQKYQEMILQDQTLSALQLKNAQHEAVKVMHEFGKKGELAKQFLLWIRKELPAEEALPEFKAAIEAVLSEHKMQNFRDAIARMFEVQFEYQKMSVDTTDALKSWVIDTRHNSTLHEELRRLLKKPRFKPFHF